jgi:hypothetical protein
MTIGFEILSLITFSVLLLQTQVFEDIETVIMSHRNFFSTYASIGIQLLFESFENTFEVWDTGVGSVITASMTLAILVLFFLAIVQRVNK